jgi:DNA-binding SARP family transcriptional activator
MADVVPRAQGARWDTDQPERPGPRHDEGNSGMSVLQLPEGEPSSRSTSDRDSILTGRAGSARLGGDKPRRLLGALALHANEVVPADRLIDLAWGDSPPRSAHANLLTYLSGLRRALRSCDGLSIEARPPGYRLAADPQSLDWLRFLAVADAAREVRPADPAKAGLLLREALALWRGPVLADVADRLTLLQPRIAALEEARLSAQVLCVDADLLAGRQADLLGELAELTGDHSLHEQLRGQHMLALYRCGRQADALAVFHQLREQLRDELGVDPGPGLGRLYQAILRADPQLDYAAAPGSPAAMAAGETGPAGPAAPPASRSAPARWPAAGDDLVRLDDQVRGNRTRRRAPAEQATRNRQVAGHRLPRTHQAARFVGDL